MTMQSTLDLFDVDHDVPRLSIAFRSGMSAVGDFRGAAAAGVAIGVVAGELPTVLVFLAAPRLLAEGGALFVDSGAFSEMKTGDEPDFNAVLTVYSAISGATKRREDRARLFVVAPDKVGDQLETLARLARYRSRMRALIDQGCSVIVPVQRGALPAAEMLDRIADVLGTRNFVAGIPANKDALSIADCATLRHDRFHILGRVQINQDQAARIHALTFKNPGAVLTADANWLRGKLGDVTRLSQNMTRARAVEAAIRQDATWAR